MAETITGKVAAIIDDTTLVLNVGGRDGVCEGQVFAVVAAHQEVCDPDTGESLGRWESVKGRVVITHVQERMATARSPVAEAALDTGTLSAMMVRHSFGLYGSRDRDREALPVRGGAASGRPRAQPIEVGDPVRSVSLAGLAEAARADAGAGGAAAAPDLPSQSYAVSAPVPAPAPATESAAGAAA